MKSTKEKVFKYIPYLILIFWLIFALIHESFYLKKLLEYADFQMYYRAGEKIWIDFTKIYEVSNFFYGPIFAVFSAVFFVPFPLWEAHFVLMSINIVLGIFFIRELDKIFKFLGLTEIKYRTIFLIIACSSWYLYAQFYAPQAKLIFATIFIWSIRKRLEKVKLNSYWNYVLDYALIIFAISIVPTAVFFFLLILEYDIGGIKNILKKKSIKLYIIFVLLLLLENFLFLLSPQLFLDWILAPFNDYLSNVSYRSRIFYLGQFLKLEGICGIRLIFTSLLILGIVFLLFKNISFEKKIGYGCLGFLLFEFWCVLWESCLRACFFLLQSIFQPPNPFFILIRFQFA